MRSKERPDQPGTVLVIREFGLARYNDPERDSFLICTLEPNETRKLYSQAREPITAHASPSGKHPLVTLKIPLHVLPIGENGDIIASIVKESQNNKLSKKRLVALQERQEVVIYPLDGWGDQSYLQASIPDIPGSRITHLQMTADQLEELQNQLGNTSESGGKKPKP